MDIKEEHICRLCLRVAVNDFKIIDENTRKIFEVILLGVNLDVSKDPIICEDCAEITKKCFDFKSVCIDTEKDLLSFMSDRSEVTCKLKDVFKNGKDMEIVDDNFICRFCSNYSSRDYVVFLETLMNDVKFAKMLKVLMPQMDFTIIEDPVICTSCNHNLECYIKFVENCLEVEEKITKYFQNEATCSSVQVKLSQVLHFKNILELDFTPIHPIKLEKNEFEDMGEENFHVYNGGLIKTEEKIIKDEEFDISETACETGSDLCKSNIPCGLKVQNRTLCEATNLNRFLEPTMRDHRMCMCDTTPHCSNECHSSVRSLETGMGRLYQTDYKCNVNRQTLSIKNILKCTMCTFQTKQKGNFNRHLLIHKDNAEVKMYKCLKCIFETKHKWDLAKHMVIHKDITEVEMYKCSKCTYKTKHKANLKRHMLVHKDITDVQMYNCSMCTYETKHKGYFKQHMLIVHRNITEMEMYKCSMCTYETKLKGGLKKHMLKIHNNITEVKMYKCTICTFETRYKRGINRHLFIHKVNTEEKMCKCPKCTYVTKYRSELTRHMLIHKDITEVDIYKCPKCTYETRHKKSVKLHMLVHKDITEVKTYKCSKCTFETRYKSGLKSHKLIHKDINEVEMYKCALCTFETKRKSGLRRHVLIHKDITELDMYKCSTCTYETKYKGDLTKHMFKIHKEVTEEEMYKCAKCTYETKCKSYIKRHMQKHHRDGDV